MNPLIVILLFWFVLIGGIGYTYLSNYSFRLYVNLQFNPTSEHVSLSDKASPPLPLPKKVVFAYRYSNNGAAYYTTQPCDNIIAFFKGVANKDGYAEYSDIKNGIASIDLKYSNCSYIVKIKKSLDPRGYYIYIDSK